MTHDEILAQYGPREAMEYDVVVVGAGPAGLATAIRLKQLAAEHGKESRSSCSRRARSPARTSSPARSWTRARINELIPDWKEMGAPLNQPVTGDDVPVPHRDRRHARRPNCAAARLLPQRRQLRRQPGQRRALAGAAGRSAGRRDLPGLPGRRGALQRRRLGQGRGHRQHGHRQGRRADRELPARHGAARQVHDLRRRRARPPGPPADRELQARRGPRPAELRHRHQGAVGDRPGASHEPGLVVHTAGWPLDSRHLRRLVPVPPGEQPGRRSASSSASTTRTRT